MKTVVVTGFYGKPWRFFFPIRFLSMRKICFGNESIVEFDFKINSVFSSNLSSRREIARIISNRTSCNSIDSFFGEIIAPQFLLSISKGAFFGGPSIKVQIKDTPVGPSVVEITRVQLSSEFYFNKFITCNYDLANEKLEVSYLPEYEDLAQVISSLLFHLLTSMSNIRSS